MAAGCFVDSSIVAKASPRILSSILALPGTRKFLRYDFLIKFLIFNVFILRFTIKNRTQFVQTIAITALDGVYRYSLRLGDLPESDLALQTQDNYLPLIVGKLGHRITQKLR